MYPFQGLVRMLVDRLVHGDYQGVLEVASLTRLSQDELRRSVAEYGRVLSMPPASSVEKWDAVRVESAPMETYSLRVPLWTVEEGRSDLTLELTLRNLPTGWKLEIDDLHVL